MFAALVTLCPEGKCADQTSAVAVLNTAVPAAALLANYSRKRKLTFLCTGKKWTSQIFTWYKSISSEKTSPKYFVLIWFVGCAPLYIHIYIYLYISPLVAFSLCTMVSSFCFSLIAFISIWNCHPQMASCNHSSILALQEKYQKHAFNKWVSNNK